jgi:hypothetical protein
MAPAVLVIAGCGDGDAREPVYPELASTVAWFGEGTQARMNGNVLEIRGELDPEYLRRGGTLWSRAAPYFYLFNVEIRDLLVDYPDVAGVRAVVYDRDGDELARATLPSRSMNEYEWRQALALASLAQSEGTEHPGRLERLTRFGEEFADYEYEGG